MHAKGTVDNLLLKKSPTATVQTKNNRQQSVYMCSGNMEQCVLTTLNVTFNNIESAPNTHQTKPKTTTKIKNKTQNTNRHVSV